MFLRRTKGLPFPAFLSRSQGRSLQFWAGLRSTFYFILFYFEPVLKCGAFHSRTELHVVVFPDPVTAFGAMFFHFDFMCRTLQSLCEGLPQTHCNLQGMEAHRGQYQIIRLYGINGHMNKSCKR